MIDEYFAEVLEAYEITERINSDLIDETDCPRSAMPNHDPSSTPLGNKSS